MNGRDMTRRSIDCVLAGVGLIVVALPVALGAVLIKLTSPGPAFYRQIRVGRGGREFWFYKLRTMTAASGAGPQVTALGDPRITGIGKLLRRYKIDELPQLWNVLKGDMSVIGPRPEVPRFVEHYSPEQRAILGATPGLASVSQLVYPQEADVLRGSSDPELAYVRYLMPLKIQADLDYEATRTLGSDVRVMLELALFVFGKSFRQDRSFTLPVAPAEGGR